MKLMTLVVFLLVVLFAGDPLMADDGVRDPQGNAHHGMRRSGPGMPGHEMLDPERMVRHISSWLELDDAQTQELTNVVRAAEPQIHALRERA